MKNPTKEFLDVNIMSRMQFFPLSLHFSNHNFGNHCFTLFFDFVSAYDAIINNASWNVLHYAKNQVTIICMIKLLSRNKKLCDKRK